MRISAVICEYNPFHNGHKYQLNEIRKQLGSDYIITIMSGNFVQRGAPAICDKYARAAAALDYADLILELPVTYATSSAEGFARGAVKILDGLGCVNDLVFGAETAQTTILSQIADILIEEPAPYKKALLTALKHGASYPAARQDALRAYLGPSSDIPFEEILMKPNNLLGLEYIKAIRQLGSKLHPVIIQRIGADYHDTSVGKEGAETLASATAIRNELLSGRKPPANALPSSMNQYLSIEFSYEYPVTSDDLSDLLFYRLDVEPHPEEILDYHPELWDRIRKFQDQAGSFEHLIQLVKTKNFTYTRISRFLLHMVLSIRTSDYEKEPCYGKILGFQKDASGLLKLLKTSARIPVIQKISHYGEVLDEDQRAAFELDLSSGRIYYQIIRRKFQTALADDLHRPPLIK